MNSASKVKKDRVAWLMPSTIRIFWLAKSVSDASLARFFVGVNVTNKRRRKEEGSLLVSS